MHLVLLLFQPLPLSLTPNRYSSMHSRVQQYAQQCTAVCTAVYSSMHSRVQQYAQQSTAVCTAEYSSMHSRVQQCTQQCTAVYTAVYSSVHSSVQQCTQQCTAVYTAVYSSVLNSRVLIQFKVLMERQRLMLRPVSSPHNKKACISPQVYVHRSTPRVYVSYFFGCLLFFLLEMPKSHKPKSDLSLS